MLCPICHSEYRRGLTHCLTCDIDLVDLDHRPYRSFTIGVLAVGALLITLVSLIASAKSRRDSPGSLWLWTVILYFLFGLSLFRIRSRAAGIVGIVGSVLLAASSVVFLTDALLIHPDPLNFFGLTVLLVLQLIGVAASVLLAWVLESVFRARERKLAASEGATPRERS